MKLLPGKILIERFGLEYFKEASSFGALSDAAIGCLLESGAAYQLDKDDILFSEGDASESFFIVLKGEVTLFKPTDQKNIHLTDFSFGEELGFAPLIALSERTATAQASEESIVLEISSGLFYEFHNAFPAEFGLLLLNLSREMARRILKINEIRAAGL